MEKQSSQLLGGGGSTVRYLSITLCLSLFAITRPAFADVNPDGSFSRSIPIEIPPGRNGIQPNLALVYNCNSGNGMLGVGWSLKQWRKAYDNAVAESFFGTLKSELAANIFGSHAETRREVFDYIECFYNTERMHSYLGYKSPVEFEQEKAA